MLFYENKEATAPSGNSQKRSFKPVGAGKP
jgi:hypothetical protein